MLASFPAAHRSALRGLLAHYHAMTLIVSSPGLILYCLPCMVTTLCVAIGTSSLVWALGLIFLRPFGYVVSFHSVLAGSSIFVLQIVLSAASVFNFSFSPAFFASYRRLLPREAEALRKRKVVRGLRAQLFELFSYLVLGFGALTVGVATIGLWLPFAVSLAAAFFTPAGAPLLAVGGIGLVLLVAVAPVGKIFYKLQSLLPLSLAALAALLAAAGLLSRSTTTKLMEMVSAYLLAQFHAKQLLAQFGIRCTAEEWKRWCNGAHWELVGLGAPLAFLYWAKLHPLLFLSALEVSHIAAAALLRDLGQEPRPARGGAARAAAPATAGPQPQYEKMQ